MQLPVLLQALTECAGCLLNRWQGGHNLSAARCRVEKNLLPLPGLKPWTVARVAAVDTAMTTLLGISIKPSSGVRTRIRWGGAVNKDGAVALGNNWKCHATYRHTHQLHSRQNIAALLCVCGRSPRRCCRSSLSTDCAYSIYSEPTLRHTPGFPWKKA